MTENPPKPPASEFPASEGWPDYPGFGSPDDVQARIRLLMWIPEQLGPGKVEANEGDYVLATDGRILGVGPDPDELERRVLAAEPELLNARVVVWRVPPMSW